jgi:hypothetical protein
VSHNTLLVYDVSHPTGKEAEGVGNPVESPDPPSLVAEQGEGQIVLCSEALVRFYGIGTYPYDLGIELSELLVIIPKGASLLCAAGCIVLWVEEEDNRPVPQGVLQADHLSHLRGECEVRSLRPYFHFTLRSLNAHRFISRVRGR